MIPTTVQVMGPPWAMSPGPGSNGYTRCHSEAPVTALPQHVSRLSWVGRVSRHHYYHQMHMHLLLQWVASRLESLPRQGLNLMQARPQQ
jgi:hypothetical protein